MHRCVAVARVIPAASASSSARRYPLVTTFAKTALILSSSFPIRFATSSAVVITMSTTPSRPLQYTQRSIDLDLSAFSEQISQAEDVRQNAYDLSRKLQVEIVKARSMLESCDSDNGAGQHQALTKLIEDSFPSQADRNPREANLSNRMEDYVRLMAYEYFLKTGRLLPPSHCPYATDEEYLAGSCMGAASDLAHYGMGRATARDATSVGMARDLVQEVMNELLQFDFRNGPLRRKYDGTKYSLKALETLLYELSVTGTQLVKNESEEPNAKRLRLEGLLPKDELTALRKRMEHRDELRENLIKKCRDGQKAAKQSIFALHRGDRKKAKQLIEQCETCITNDLLPIVTEETPLRSSGSFTGVLEEYAEATMFYAWLYGKDDGTVSPRGDLLLPEDFASIKLEPAEYLGGLCDLTGEVGRYSVQRGTARDTDAVKMCLSTNASILSALQMMPRLPGTIGKKMDPLRRAVEKIERMLYEMSLSEATGRNMKSDMDTNQGEVGGDADEG